MAKVYDGAVRFMRKVQVKEYEPVEAEVSLKFQLEDGDDHVALLAQIGTDARTAVISMIKGKFEAQGMPTDQAEAVATAVDQSKPGSAAKVEPKAEVKTEAKANGASMPDEGEPAKPAKRTRGPGKKTAEASSASMPDEDGGEATETPAATNGSTDPASAMPDDDAGVEDWENAAPAEEEKLTAADIQGFISKQVQGGKITVPDVKAILAKFGAHGVRDVKEAELGKLKAAIQADCKA